MRIRVGLLGPIEVTVDAQPRMVSGLRRKAVLAVLGLRAGDVVSADSLIDIVWGGRSPATAVNTLQSHVSHLRREFGMHDAIVAHPPGYRLAASTDLQEAERLIAEGTRAAQPQQRVEILRAALGLWRGTALVDVSGLAWLEEQADRLERTRLAAVHALTDARLALGEHALLVPELAEQSERHPFDEDLHRQLMLALYRSGRQADALATYQRLRRRLDDELGVDPGPALRELESSMLRQDSTLDLPAAEGPILVPAKPAVPAHLPPALTRFVARGPELACIDKLLGTGQIAVLSGTAGVGKTTLAVQWAHRNAERFPDGQLYVNLRGFGAESAVMEPEEAVRGFLDALGVPPERIPPTLDAQVALYRSLLAGKRVLVVLDNARDAGQVRPLLPGTPGCAVLVTSRTQLTSLAVVEAASSLAVDLLGAAQARALLSARLGEDRLAESPEAVDDIVARCAGLPLALAIIAARAAADPGLSLAKFAAELAQALDALSVGEAVADVAAVFSWSYGALGPDTAKLFRLLGLHPGPGLTVDAAAGLAGVTPKRARSLLHELTEAHLLMRHEDGRYHFHDLLRAYAERQVHVQETEAERREALRRLLDHYLQAAFGAAVAISPHRPRIDVGGGAVPGTGIENPMAWLLAECRVLLALIDLAFAEGFDGHAWRLAWTLTSFLTMVGMRGELAMAGRTALAAARRAGDPAGQAHALRGLGFADMSQGRFTEALDHLRAALRLFGQAGEHVEQARVHLNLANLFDRHGRPDEALEHALLGLDRSLIAGDPGTEGDARNAVALYYARAGEHDRALEYCLESVRLLAEIGHDTGEALARDTLAYIYENLGEHRQAIANYRYAARVFGERGDLRNEAETLTRLGDCHEALGEPAAAHDARLAAEAVRAKLEHPARS
ncbi:AfsR/SARP family transcriptional regulator [Allorhizocola rhizosphaerae]|uniref:AfsR/SARP family transcriptional regulator n=1 Tax=Allorhizocola rhizosphaerae TaxID=1872709 RepID=UPI000E3CBED9|nr:BTAD domain-containing putative transcriptional regulator [Allorhizocola rhizosphaerae]